MNAIELMEKSFCNINEAERLEEEASELRLKAIKALLLSLDIEERKTIFETPAGNKGVFCIVKNYANEWSLRFYRLKKNGTPSSKANYEDELSASFMDAGLVWNEGMYKDKEGNLYSEGAAFIKKLEYMISQYKNTGESC